MPPERAITMHLMLAAAAAIAYGGADFIGGLASRRAAILPVIVTSQVLAFGLVLIAAPLFGGSPEPARDYGWGAAAGLAYAVGVYLLYRALAQGPMSIAAPIAGVCGIAFPVAFGLAIGEKPSVWALAGIALAASSIVLISREPQDDVAHAQPQRASREVVLTAIGAGVAFGGFFVTLSRTNADAGLWPLIATRGVALLGFVTLALATRVPLRLDPSVRRLALASGSLDVAANALFLLAVQGALISLAATLTSLYPAATVALAALLLRERVRRAQALGLLLAAIAVAAIGLTRTS